MCSAKVTITMAQPEYGADSCQNMSHSNTSSPMASASLRKIKITATQYISEMQIMFNTRLDTYSVVKISAGPTLIWPRGILML